jgi:hypothetical protein
MLSSEEYEKLLPHREEIFRWKETGNYKGSGMTLIDRIRQGRGYRAICYACMGDKIEALKDVYQMIIEYEKEKSKTNTG